MNLGKNIHSNRMRCRLSQGELADALDVSRQSISKWENNAATPELDKLIRMCKVFGISLDELVFACGTTACANDAPSPDRAPIRRRQTVLGLVLLAVGFLGFLTAGLWAAHLTVSEELWEMISLCTLCIGAATLKAYDFKALSLFAIGVFMYLIGSFGLLEIRTYNNMFFIIALGLIVWGWFFVLMTHANKPQKENDQP